MNPITYPNYQKRLKIEDMSSDYKAEEVKSIMQPEEQLQILKELHDYKYALDETAIVVITDPNGIIKHVNLKFCEVSGYDAQDVLGKNHNIINAGYHNDDFFSELWNAITKGEIWRGEIKNLKKNGEYYWVDTTIIPFLNEVGKPYQYVSIKTDITEQVYIKEKVIENERFIKAITDNVPAMIGYWNCELKCLFANDAYKKQFGKTQYEINLLKKKDLLSKEEYKKHLPYIQQVLQGNSQSFESSFNKSDGTTSFTSCQYIPDIENGNVKGFYSLISDITAQKNAELEIKKKTEQIENILNILDDGFISFDEQNNCVYANRKATEIFPLFQNNIASIDINELFPNTSLCSVQQAVEQVKKENKLVTNEYYNSNLGAWMENRIYPTPKGISILVRDISERKNNEKKQIEFNERVSLISKTINDALFEWNFETNELWWSYSHFTLFGFDPDQPIPAQNEWLKKIHPENRKQLLDSIQNVLHNGITEWQKEIKFLRKDETYGTLYTRYFVVRDQAGRALRLIGSFIDITDKKTADEEKILLADLVAAFSRQYSLDDCIKKTLKLLAAYGDFPLMEAWIVNKEKGTINLAAYHCNKETKNFYDECSHITYFRKGEGFIGSAWQKKKILLWNVEEIAYNYTRTDCAIKAGLKMGFAVPLIAGDEVIGVLGFGMTAEKPVDFYNNLFLRVGTQLGNEIQRKQLEDELYQIVNFAPDIICIMSVDGTLKKVNPAMCALLEYEENEILSKNLFELIHTGDIDKSNATLLKLERGETTNYCQNRLITKSGKIKWFSWNCRPVERKELIYGVAKEITNEKTLELLLYKANHLARIGEWEVNLTENTTYWSAIAKEIHEVARDYTPSLNSLNNFYGDNTSGNFFASLLANAILSKTAFDKELQIVTATGNKKWIRVIGEPEFINDKCVKLYGSFQDIDVRKNAEIAAIEALGERNTILESIGDAFFAVDKDWTVTYWNKEAEKVLGKPREVMLGHNLWSIFNDVKTSISYKKYTEALTTKKSVHFEDYYQPLDKWYEVSAYPLENGLSVYFKDITERREYEEMLKKLNSKLQKHAKELMDSNAELEQFAYVASHDLQEPLRMVTSFLTQIEKKYNDILDERGKKYIHFAVDGAMRMRQIILDLLEFSRVGKQQQSIQLVDIQELVWEIKSLYKKSFTEKKATLITKNLPTVNAAKAPLRLIFQNIISNSLKYSKPGIPANISIACDNSATEWQFSISDNGIGINPEYFDKIFIIFQRLHNRTDYSGTGMGLAVAKKTVENMGGRIWVESIEGEGSTFHFTVPKPILS